MSEEATFAGQYYHSITNNLITRSRLAGIVCGGIKAGLRIQSNTVIDVGETLGDIPVGGLVRACIQAEGCPGALITGNTIGLFFFTKPDFDIPDPSNNRIGIYLGAGMDFDAVTPLLPRGMLVSDNSLFNLNIGIWESGVAAAGDADNYGHNFYHSNLMRDMTQPQKILGADTRWNYTNDGTFLEGVGLINTTIHTVRLEGVDPGSMASGAYGALVVVPCPSATLGDKVASVTHDGGLVNWAGSIAADGQAWCIPYNGTLSARDPGPGTLVVEWQRIATATL